MDRTEVTAAMVRKAESMLDAGARHATIAGRLGLTSYVVGLLARNRHLPPGGPSSRSLARRIPNTQRGIDAPTIRMVRRMLDVGILPQVEIARLAGVSANTVGDVASGKRLPLSTWEPYLQAGERFLSEPIRCSVCRGLVTVVPCRACRTRREIVARKKSV
jgi:hypothetical protein